MSARASGYLVDSVLVGLISIVLLVVLGLIHGPVVEIGGSGELADRVEVDRARFAIDSVVLAVASGVYFAGSWVRRGATVGQRWTGLSVLTALGGQLPAPRWAVVRFISLGSPLWVIAGLLSGNARLLMWVLGAAWYVMLPASVIRGSSTTGIHDRIARTIVVREVVPLDVPALLLDGADG